jgi:hypothetical protein
MGLGKSMAAGRLAPQHALLVARLFVATRRGGQAFEGFAKLEDGLFCFLDSGLCSFTPLEFSHCALEWECAFR